MSSYPGTGLPEPKKPGFLHRPVPMWAFLLLVVIIGIVIFLPAFFPSSFVAIKQPLILSSDNQTLSIINGTVTTANFTVANLNVTSAISTTANATLVKPNSHITLSISGVQTGNVFAASPDRKSVTFQPGGNTLVVRISADATAVSGNYTLHVSLAS
jgi:hypothetical protein